MSDIKNWNIDDIRNFHKQYYAPNNATLIVAGDIDKKSVFKFAKEHFSKIKPSKSIKSNLHTVEPTQEGAKRMTLYKDSEVQMLAIAYHIPDFKHKDQIALSALSSILSGSKSSRLSKVLKDEKSMVNTIYAYNMESIDPSVFLFLAVCNPNVDAKEVESIILDEIKKIKNGDIEDFEIQKVKVATKSAFIHSLESSSSIAQLIGRYMVMGDIKPLEDYEKNIQKLKKDDIIKVAKNYFREKNSTTIILKKEEIQ
jgi:predicted Zn-dependent peptidase